MSYDLETFRGDLFGGVTSMVVALPVALTVFVDLVTAVAIGLIAAGMAHARQLERLELDSVVSVPLLDWTFLSDGEDTEDTDPHAARVGLVALRGTFTVASSHKLVEVIGADIKDHEVVIFDFSQVTCVDDSAAMVIEQLIDVARNARTGVIVMGLSGSVARTLRALECPPAGAGAVRLRDAGRGSAGGARSPSAQGTGRLTGNGYGAMAWRAPPLISRCPSAPRPFACG